MEVKGEKRLLGEMKVEQRRCRRLVAEAEAEAEEAKRQMSFMKTALERQDVRKVAALQKELCDLQYSRRNEVAAKEEIKRAFRAQGRYEMKKVCNDETEVALRCAAEEAEVALRVLRL